MTTKTIVLTDEQQHAVSRIQAWAAEPVAPGWTPQYRLGGLAGTGKTTIIDFIRREMSDRTTATLTPTGKAAEVLRRKGVNAETIHSYIYIFQGLSASSDRMKRVYNDDGEAEERAVMSPQFATANREDSAPDLIIVDEASMVNSTLYEDLIELGVPVLWVGDHGQLPPVGGDPKIMSNLDSRLETIHRQAQGNPILEIAHHARTGGRPNDFAGERPGLKVGRTSDPRRIVEVMLASGIEQAIVGFNETRHKINREMRLQKFGVGTRAGSRLVSGERLICTKNSRRDGVFNGMIFIVEQVLAESEEAISVTIYPEGMPEQRRSVVIYPHALGDRADDHSREQASRESKLLFDYGYAITAHKSQGSEWPSVLVVDEPCRNWSMPRWRYTAYTRAKERLFVAYA